MLGCPRRRVIFGYLLDHKHSSFASMDRERQTETEAEVGTEAEGQTETESLLFLPTLVVS